MAKSIFLPLCSYDERPEILLNSRYLNIVGNRFGGILRQENATEVGELVVFSLLEIRLVARSRVLL